VAHHLLFLNSNIGFKLTHRHRKEECTFMLLFYFARKDHVVDKLETALMRQLPSQKVLYCNNLEDLEWRLRRPRRDLEILLVFIGDAIEMAKLSSLRTLLLDLRMVLVLPFRDADTVAWAHTLGPRFIAYADSGEDPIAAVLTKMLTNGHTDSYILGHKHSMGNVGSK
jgi:hypothetical protein